MKYADALAAKEARAPLATVQIPPRVWAQSWADRPIEVVTCGLRSLSETVLGEVTGAARSRADRLVPGGGERDRLWADEYNAAVQTFAVGRALCQPECADAPWWDYPDMLAPLALSPEGAAWLYSRFAASVVSRSILAEEEEPGALVALLTALPSVQLTPARRSQASRHLRAALDILEGR